MTTTNTGMFGIWSYVSKQFVFGIQEPSKTKARNKLFDRIGKNAYKWRFEARKIKDCPQHREMFNQPLKLKNQNEKRKLSMAKINGTKVTTNEVRMSYAQVFEPKAMEGSEPKYSVSLLIPKSDTETIALIEKAIAAAAEEGKAKLGGKIPAKLKTTFRDGDDEKPEDEAYAGHMFLNCSSKTKPGVIKSAAPGSGVKFETITDESEFYSGCYGKAVVNFFAYNANGNKGVSAGLNNLLKTRDGETFAGKANAEDDFADEVEGEDDDFLS